MCKWTEEQWLLLQEVFFKWQRFTDDQKQFSDWLADKEALLNRMRSADMSDANQVIDLVKKLKVSYLL